MICNTLLACCLLLQSTIVPLSRPVYNLPMFWQTPMPVASVAGIQTPPRVTPKPTPKPVATSWDSMVPLINKERLAAGLSPLTQNAKLDTAAKAKACDMVNRKYFAHKDPEGKDAWHLFNEAGYKYQYAGENLAEGFSDDALAMSRFMGSQAHKDNILNTHYKEVGIGRCGKYIVQHYGRR